MHRKFIQVKSIFFVAFAIFVIMYRKFIQVMSIFFVAFAIFAEPRFVEKFCYHDDFSLFFFNCLY